MTSRARPGISKGLLAQLIALVRADEAGSVGDETEMVDLGGIAAAAVAERVPAALAAGVDIQLARRKASDSGGCHLMRNRFPRNCRIQLGSLENVVLLTGDRKFESISLQR